MIRLELLLAIAFTVIVLALWVKAEWDHRQSRKSRHWKDLP